MSDEIVTLAQFKQLRAGDIILLNGTERTVIEGPNDNPRYKDDWHPTRNWVRLAIRRKSWTRRAYTLYCYCDIKDRIVLTGLRTNRICLKEELLNLKKIGFDPARELVREIREHTAEKIRMGRPLCKTLRRLPV